MARRQCLRRVCPGVIVPQRARGAVLQHHVPLRGCQPKIQRHQHGTQSGQRKQGHQLRGMVEPQVGHTVPRAQAPRLQLSHGLRHSGGQRGIGPGLRFKFQGELGGSQRGLMRQHAPKAESACSVGRVQVRTCLHITGVKTHARIVQQQAGDLRFFTAQDTPPVRRAGLLWN